MSNKIKAIIIAAALSIGLCSCKNKVSISCQGISKIGQNSPGDAYYSLPNIQDHDTLFSTLSIITKHCEIPSEIEETYLESLARFAKDASQDELIDIYKALQNKKEKFRVDLLNFSNYLKFENSEKSTPANYKFYDEHTFKEIGVGLSMEYPMDKRTSLGDAINFDLNDDFSRIYKIYGFNKKVLIQIEDFFGGSGGSAVLSIYDLNTGKAIPFRYTNGRIASSTDFNSWGSAGNSGGAFVFSSDNQLIGFAKIHILEDTPDSIAANASINCKKVSIFYSFSASEISSRLAKEENCNSDDGTSFDAAYFGQHFISLTDSKNYFDIASLINYDRMDLADKSILRMLVSKGNIGKFLLVKNFGSRLSIPEQQEDLEYAKIGINNLLLWKKHLAQLSIYIDISKSEEIKLASSSIDKVNSSLQQIPDVSKYETVKNKLERYKKYTVIVNRQMPGQFIRQGKTYNYLYETLDPARMGGGNPIVLVVSDTPVFNHQGYQQVLGIEISKTETKLSEKLGGFDVLTPVIEAASEEDLATINGQKSVEEKIKILLDNYRDAVNYVNIANDRLQKLKFISESDKSNPSSQ